jgi:chorismate mutase
LETKNKANSFEGVGTKGLPWLQKVKEQTGLPVCVEVAKASHVEVCLEFGIDVLWIGARTTVNPFSVQEIADALKGVDIPVMIKNPINPDLELWMGAFERIEKSGIKKMAAIHRGFSFSGEKVFRNRPQWSLAIDFKTKNPDIPIINDPSHICGRRDLLQSVAQKAMDLNFDGLMIESHITPDEAWSDAKQQITPEVYGEMISSLILRKESAEYITNDLENFRRQIDIIDDELIHLLSSRMKISRDIGKYKKDNSITILQSSRWKEILDKFLLKASPNQLSEDFVARFIKAIHDESIEQQEKIING